MHDDLKIDRKAITEKQHTTILVRMISLIMKESIPYDRIHFRGLLTAASHSLLNKNWKFSSVIDPIEDLVTHFQNHKHEEHSVFT